MPAKKKSDQDTVTATPSSSTSSTKPIVTTAPSKTPSPSTMPALKQKTGIIKSKVPPPVPPRGSPRDRRSAGNGGANKTGLSPRGTPPSSGSVNYLNDKYFNVARPNPNATSLADLKSINTPVAIRSALVNEQIFPTALILRPVFGERRSPTCVQDWLEVNDFGSSDFDRKIIEWTHRAKDAAKMRKPIPIKTAILQREDSFRNISNSSGSVRSLAENIESKIAAAAAAGANDGKAANAEASTSKDEGKEKEDAQDVLKPLKQSVFIKPRIRKRGVKKPLNRLNWMPGSSELDDEFCTSSRCRRNVVFDSSSRRRDMSPMPDFIKRESLYDDYREAELIFNTLQPARGRHGFDVDGGDAMKRFKLVDALSNLDVNDNFAERCLESFSEGEFV